MQLELIAWLIEEYPVVGGGALNKGLVGWLEVRICERDGHAGLRWEETDGKGKSQRQWTAGKNDENDYSLVTCATGASRRGG